MRLTRTNTHRERVMDECVHAYWTLRWTIADIIKAVVSEGQPRRYIVQAIEREHAALQVMGEAPERTEAQAREWDVIGQGYRTPSVPRFDVETAKGMYEAGQSLESIALAFKVHKTTIRTALIRSGGTLRKVGKPGKPKTE